MPRIGKSLARARELDPTVTYADASDQPLTLDGVSALALYYEARLNWIYANSALSWSHGRRGLAAIEKALAYRPHPATFHYEHAKLLLMNSHGKKAAIRAIDRGLETDPDNLMLLRFRDEIS